MTKSEARENRAMMLNPEREVSLGFQQYSAPTEEEKK